MVGVGVTKGDFGYACRNSTQSSGGRDGQPGRMGQTDYSVYSSTGMDKYSALTRKYSGKNKATVQQ